MKTAVRACLGSVAVTGAAFSLIACSSTDKDTKSPASTTVSAAAPTDLRTITCGQFLALSPDQQVEVFTDGADANPEDVQSLTREIAGACADDPALADKRIEDLFSVGG